MVACPCRPVYSQRVDLNLVLSVLLRGALRAAVRVGIRSTWGLDCATTGTLSGRIITIAFGTVRYCRNQYVKSFSCFFLAVSKQSDVFGADEDAMDHCGLVSMFVIDP
ncbi:hypothetical protein Tco_0894935 [Tanacetum coccineum]|uniref:Uncharacterized protein n=1 Tax=Tanacetum coccineum TaxID=301880 RepID=A0ABQ5CED4_9ASTR